MGDAVAAFYGKKVEWEDHAGTGKLATYHSPEKEVTMSYEEVRKQIYGD